MEDLRFFRAQKSYLVCIDSDGCAMDTMNIKHRTCFGPQFVEVYGFGNYREPVQKLWEDINLYTKTRGINRFLGLALALRTIKEKHVCPSDHDFDRLERWTRETSALSNAALTEAVQKTGDLQLQLALQWSLGVNRAVSALPEGNFAYTGVGAAIEAMKDRADIVVVSSANGEAIKREWALCGFTDQVNAMAGQEQGSKADVIAHLLETGRYDPQRVLMIGDAPGDLAAARKNNVLFYPILAGKEEQSWAELPKDALEPFFSGTYAAHLQNKLIRAFAENLA